MIELPEAAALVRQMNAELSGKQIMQAVCGASPHKFAFFNRSANEYGPILCGKTYTGGIQRGAWMYLTLEPGWVLVLGELAGHVRYFVDAANAPHKHQLLLTFNDGSALAVILAMWGAVQLVPQVELAAFQQQTEPHRSLDPLGNDFTFDYFRGLLTDPVEYETKSVKAFMISKPGLRGVGNGCLQDILFRARLHPRRRIKDLTAQEQRDLYDCVRTTLTEMVRLGGRDLERDLYQCPGGYPNQLDSRSLGMPCPVCATPIEKIAYLGGTSYFCPTCQK